jgi:hypothetical protein
LWAGHTRLKSPLFTKGFKIQNSNFGISEVGFAVELPPQKTKKKNKNKVAIIHKKMHQCGDHP